MPRIPDLLGYLVQSGSEWLKKAASELCHLTRKSSLSLRLLRLLANANVPLTYAPTHSVLIL